MDYRDRYGEKICIGSILKHNCGLGETYYKVEELDKKIALRIIKDGIGLGMDILPNVNNQYESIISSSVIAHHWRCL